MDKLNRKVSKIESSIQATSKGLQKQRENANSQIGSEIAAMRDALLRGQQSIEHVTSETKGFMLTLDDHRTSDIDLKPQMSWLSKNITSVLWELNEAESKASRAMQRTMDYQVVVGDVEQRLNVRQQELDQAQAEGDDLKNSAMQEYWDNMRLVREAKETIEKKNREISSKQWQADQSRKKLQEHRNKLSTLNSTLDTKRRQAEKAKDKAWIGGALAVGGILAAPFTGGASLGLTAASGSYSIKKAVDYDDLKDEIRTTQNSIVSLESEVQSADLKVSTLNSEKADLQRHLCQLETLMSGHQAAKEGNEKQIARADILSKDISNLTDQASKATAEARDSMCGLQELKQKLNQVATSISSQSTSLEVETSTLDQRLIPRKPLAKQFTREKAAIEKAAKALASAQTQLPGLLDGTKIKLLEMKPVKADVYISSIFQEDIPTIKFRSTPNRGTVVLGSPQLGTFETYKSEDLRKNEVVVTVSLPGAFPED